MVSSREQHAPLGKGMYTFSDVDQLLHLKRGQAYRMLRGKCFTSDVGIYGSRGYTHIDFLTMIELMVVKKLRDHGVKASEIRKARSMLIKEGFTHPFADSRLRTDGSRVIWDNAAAMIEVTSSQTMFRKVMNGLLKQISFSDKDFRAVKFFPLGVNKTTVVIDPKFAFGSPSVAGTRIKTKVLYGYHKSGWTNSKIAAEFNLKSQAVADALTYEESLQEPARA